MSFANTFNEWLENLPRVPLDPKKHDTLASAYKSTAEYFGVEPPLLSILEVDSDNEYISKAIAINEHLEREVVLEALEIGFASSLTVYGEEILFPEILLYLCDEKEIEALLTHEFVHLYKQDEKIDSYKQVLSTIRAAVENSETANLNELVALSRKIITDIEYEADDYTKARGLGEAMQSALEKIVLATFMGHVVMVHPELSGMYEEMMALLEDKFVQYATSSIQDHKNDPLIRAQVPENAYVERLACLEADNAEEQQTAMLPKNS